MNALQTLISERMATLELTYRKAAAKSDGKVSHATLNSIVIGKHSWKLDETTIEGIALALDVEPDEVRKAAGQAKTAEATTRFELPPRADRLSAKERRAVLTMVDALLTAAAGDARDRESESVGSGQRRSTD